PTKEALANPTAEEQQAMAELAEHRKWGTGYSKQQSTRPQTLGYGLVDSPVGQLAWIVEKFWAWMDCDGNPENVLSRDELLDNVMVYWVTGTGASSARLYWQSFKSFGKSGRVELPTGIAAFPKEIAAAARTKPHVPQVKLVAQYPGPVWNQQVGEPQRRQQPAESALLAPRPVQL